MSRLKTLYLKGQGSYCRTFEVYPGLCTECVWKHKEKGCSIPKHARVKTLAALAHSVVVELCRD